MVSRDLFVVCGCVCVCVCVCVFLCVSNRFLFSIPIGLCRTVIRGDQRETDLSSDFSCLPGYLNTYSIHHGPWL